MSHAITHSILFTQVLATSTDTFAFTLVFILMLGVFLAASYQYISKKVKETSLRYKAISALNDRTAFADIQPEYIHWEALRSKSQFDRYDFDKHLQTVLVENIDHYTAVLNDAAKNEKALRYYDASLSEVPDLMPVSAVHEYHLPFLLYRPIERTICQNLIREPVTEPEITIRASYRSPKGRNYYQEGWTYTHRTVKETMEALQRSQALRSQASYERSQLSRSLRYDILKRDHFRCVLCGASSRDGVKLHVDHIVPVSKGGRTVPENLRTLCEHCNIGKSDKFDPWGEN